MNKIRFYIISLLIGVSTLFYSCSEPDPVHFQDSETYLSFETSVMSGAVADEDGTQIKIKLFRSNTKGSLSVPLIIETNYPDIFSVNSETATFSEGQGTYEIVVTHPLASNLTPVINYPIKISYAVSEEEDPTSPAGISSVTLTITRYLTYKTYGTGTFYSEWFETDFGQTLEQSNEAPDVFRLPSLYVNGYHMVFVLNEDNSINYVEQLTGFTEGDYGAVSWYMPAAASAYQPVRDGNSFLFVPRFIVSAGSFGQFWEEFVLD